jgi:hypothetical protein
MSTFLKCLQQPEYVHVLLNHLPLAGLLAATLSLLAALAVRNRPALFIALGLVVLFSLSAWPVTEYGEAGYDRVLAMADDDGAAYLARHRDLAQHWVFMFYVTAGAGVAAVVTGFKWPKRFVLSGAVVAVLAAGSLAAGAVIAECGGKIRHREFRLGPPPKAPDAKQAWLWGDRYRFVILQSGPGHLRTIQSNGDNYENDI